MSVLLESLVRDQDHDIAERNLFWQALTFLAIGGGAAMAFVCLSSLAVGAGLPLADWIVSALCYAAFILPVYLLHRRFSFNSDAPHLQALPRYVTVQLVGLSLAALFSFLAYGIIGLPTLLASLLVIGLTSAMNFLVLKVWAFGER
ncbi:hypothetical protein GHV40_05945 [Devosia sp. D6-9]|nr:hypothetical protein GHV40_05945 [Devosia sp. D6-9]